MKRKFCVFLTVIVILTCFSIPVFASPVEESIWDYAEVQVDGFTKEVTVRFPDQFVQISLIGDNWSVLDSELGNDSIFDLSGYPANIRVFFSPLGYWFNPYGDSVYDGIALDLSDIPSDATFSVSASARVDWIDYGNGNLFMAWFNDGHVVPATGLLGYKRESLMTLSQPESSVWSATYEGSFGDTSLLYACQVQFAFQSNSSGRWRFSLDDFVIHTSIDALKQLEANTGRTNELLEEVNNKLDQITNGYDPDIDDPSGGLGEDFDNAEQEVIDKVESGRDEIDTIIDEFSVYLEEFLPGIVLVSNWLGVLLELKFIRVLLFFSLAFGMCGLFLGVANSFRGKS